MNGDFMDVDVGTNSCLRFDHSDFFVLFSLSFGDCLNSVADRELSAWAPQVNGADPALQEKAEPISSQTRWAARL